MTVPEWWKDAVVYQIYPRSFADSNSDGIGDLPGVIEKLDYLKWLGINTLWFSPFYPSPQFDVGYDVADYTGINPDYGTLGDFDRLLEGAHQRGIRVLLDLVLNHTSHEHPWFIESRMGKDAPRRDWYIWRDGKDGGPPNDWESFFGGPAWTLDEATGQYYYHIFYPQQPDLNWRNPHVQAAMFDAVRFWLERGVDGFRLDALSTLFEHPELPDANATISMADIRNDLFVRGVTEDLAPRFDHKFRYQHKLPETLDVMRALRRLCDTYEDCLLLGETEDVAYYGNGDDMLHAVFTFEITKLERLDAAAVRECLVTRRESLPEGVWEANTVGNHDRPRSMSIYADGQHDRERASVALAMTTFLWGTPVFYNGEEIGMADWHVSNAAAIRDFIGLDAYHHARAHGLSEAEAMEVANRTSRDKCRTPMQWANAPNGGFSPEGVETWLPVNPDYAQGINVADQQQDETSLLHTFRRMIQTRQTHVALRRGTLDLVDDTEGKNVLAFWRRHDDETCFVALNMTSAPVDITAGEGTLRILFSTHKRAPKTESGSVYLAPYEVCIAIAD